MKTQIKRLLALILAMAMSLSLLSANVWAAELETAEEASVSAQSSEEVITKDEPAEEEVSTEESAPAEEEISAAEEAPAAEYTEEKPAQEDTSEQSAAEEENTSSETESEANLTPQETKSGKCGKNLTWTLDESGTLTISGTGEMYYFGVNSSPWYDNRDSIHAVIINNGVTNITPHAFSSCSNLANVAIPDTMLDICDGAFRWCSSLTKVAFGHSIPNIVHSAFEYTPWFADLGDFPTVNGVLFAYQGDRYADVITIPNNVVSIRNGVFGGCYMSRVFIPDGVTSIGETAFYGCEELTSIAGFKYLY